MKTIFLLILLFSSGCIQSDLKSNKSDDSDNQDKGNHAIELTELDDLFSDELLYSFQTDARFSRSDTLMEYTFGDNILDTVSFYDFNQSRAVYCNGTASFITIKDSTVVLFNVMHCEMDKKKLISAIPDLDIILEETKKMDPIAGVDKPVAYLQEDKLIIARSIEQGRRWTFYFKNEKLVKMIYEIYLG